MAVSLMGPATGLTNSKLAMADATAERVVKGDTFYAGDKNIKIGTMPNRALSPQAGGQADTYLNDQFKNVGVSTDPTASYWLCENGDGVKRFCIRPPYGAYALGSDTSVLGTTDGYCGFPASKLGNAFNYNVLSGVKYSSENGINTTGSMPNNGAWSATIDPGQTVQVPGGYHTGGGTVRAGSVSGLLKRTTIVKTCNPGVNNFTFTGGTLVGLASVGSPGSGVNSTQSAWANGNTYGAQLAIGDSYGIQFVLVYY